MNDLIRLDTEEMLDLARSLTRLYDELDQQACRLRMLQQLIDVPQAVDDALCCERRRFSTLLEKLSMLSRRIQRVSTLFEENEYHLRREFYVEISGFQSGMNHSFPKNSISSV